jgi:hypothetical protein
MIIEERFSLSWSRLAGRGRSIVTAQPWANMRASREDARLNRVQIPVSFVLKAQ